MIGICGSVEKAHRCVQRKQIGTTTTPIEASMSPTDFIAAPIVVKVLPFQSPISDGGS
jgi:hypothetical protein